MMKKCILVALTILFPLFINAQSFKVYQKDGSSTTYEVAKVDSVVFNAKSGSTDGTDDSSNLLIGTWDVVRDTYYFEGEVEEDDPTGHYLEITATELRLHDETDLANNIWVDYTYDASTGIIKISGWGIWYVTELTSTKLVIKTAESWGGYGVMELAKRANSVKRRRMGMPLNPIK